MDSNVGWGGFQMRLRDFCALVHTQLATQVRLSWWAASPHVSILINHRIVLSTNSFSNRPTSLLKVSTSCQQSNGRLSLSLRQVMTSSFALFSAGSTCSNFFLASNFFFSASIFLVTTSRLMSFCLCFSASVAELEVASLSLSTNDGSEDSSGSFDTVSYRFVSFSASWVRSFSSSEVRRSWYCSSCCLALAESVWT